MSRGELVGGIALVALPALASALLAWRIVVGRMAHLRGEQALAAGFLIAFTAIVAIHLLPLFLGALSQATVLVATGVVAAGALALRPVRRAADGEAAAPEAPPGDPVGWGLALLGAAAIAVGAIASIRWALPNQFFNLDVVAGNLPQAARWIETGSLWQLDEYVPLQAHASYPGSGMLLFVWAMLPLDNDVLVRAVVVPVYAWWGVAAYALARELGARASAALLAACALLAAPIAAEATLEHAFPDVLLYAAMTTGGLFLVRHARSGRGSDLVLAGLGIGLGVATKWYGATAAVVLLVVWAGARLVSRRDVVATLREGTVVAGVAFLACGAWLIRNLVEIGNPIFPVKVGPIFDAAPDVVREQVGFSVAHYATDFDVLRSSIVPDVLSALGPVAVSGVVAAVVALVAGRRPGRRLVLVVALAALGLAVAYAVTPYTALGREGAPFLTRSNARYAVPALIVAVMLVAWLAGRLRTRFAAEAVLLGCVLAAIPNAFDPLRAKSLVLAAMVVAAVVAVAAILRFVVPEGRRTLATAAAGLAAAVVLVAYLDRTEDRFNAFRYRTFDPTFALLQSSPPLEVGVTGTWSLDGIAPVWPAFGDRMQNDVRYVGVEDDGWLRELRDGRAFAAQVRREDLDVLVVGLGTVPRERAPEEAYARQAGLEEVTRSRRLALYAKPELAAAARAAAGVPAG
ncbi:glycosyltransferase family 39 protein [Conexibacter sp. SYSU D00693]|uniref:glycosyltransferase family 39 protein n=1 Tax=Conexibacter sp. SYSU D00693 TaxID=2812560 RepID=UPI00196B4EAD|nr:glycosyltransferase family 39 protein [Conexibacter sp. SYSU D00693]